MDRYLIDNFQDLNFSMYMQASYNFVTAAGIKNDPKKFKINTILENIVLEKLKLIKNLFSMFLSKNKFHKNSTCFLLLLEEDKKQLIGHFFIKA